jgi:phosphate transport system permease protein
MTAGEELMLSTPAWSGRALRNNLASIVLGLTVVVVLVPLVLVVGYVVQQGRHLFGWSFLTEDIPTTRSAGPGMGPAVLGTLLITASATLMAVPLGVLGGIYLNEYGKQSRAAAVLRLLADVMTGVPSIVMGLFVYTFLVLRTQNFSGFAGALALAGLILPVVIRTTEEMLRLVPDELRHGSLALGARHATAIRTVIFPAALPGILSGALLAIARAAGETAPLLFVIGIVQQPNFSLRGANTALAVQIFRNAAQPFEGAQQRAWAAALTLILIVFLFTIMARAVSIVYTRRSGG